MSQTERRPEDDPRFQRVRASLIGALTELAAEKLIREKEEKKDEKKDE